MTTLPTPSPTSSDKWHDKTWLLIVLCIVVFPVGIYALWKTSAIPSHWKIPVTALVLVYGFMLINAKDIMLNMEDTSPTIGLENKPSQPVLDSPLKDTTVTTQVTSEAKPQDEIELKKLKLYQKKWADSIVKTENTPENGYHLVGTKLSLPDTILFEYSAGTTKHGFEANFLQDERMYREWYSNAIKSKLGEKYLSYPVYLSCIPNRKVVTNIDKSVEYEHPSLAFYGIKVYNGNEFGKELIGKVSCLYKDRSKGFGDMYAEMVIIEGKKGTIRIPHYLFRKNYWTTKQENDVSKPVIKCN